MAYVDHIDFINLKNPAVSSAFSEDKSKYLLPVNLFAIGSHITFDSHNFDVVDNFVNLGTSIGINGNASLEIQLRITHANRCNLD